MNLKNKKSFIGEHLQKAHLSKNDYRPDLDALRGIAVLAVIIFHAFPSLIPGGFVGVDIFFVISGYIISKHIVEQLGCGNFQIKEFYKRRIKRIFPALILVLLFVIIIGWVVLTPGEYELIGRSIAGGAAFAANFVFWHEAGYFDTAANTKPLLHLWSLGVEEQFYIFWPIVISTIYVKYKQHFGQILLALTTLSLIYSVFLVQNNTVADFYSPLTRFWELSLGSIIAYQEKNNRLHLSSQIIRLLPIVGIILIISSFFIIEKNYKFPGSWALLPTIGTGMLIYSGTLGSSFNKIFLSSPVLIWIGLISYPLYLWHWPLLVFSRIMNSDSLSTEASILTLAISFFLAWVTYKYVELNIRFTNKQKYTTILIIIMIIIFILGVAIKKMDGFKFRMNSVLSGDVSTLILGADREKLFNTCGLPLDDVDKYQFCLSSNTINKASIAVIGDSKSEALFYGIAREVPNDINAILIGSVRPPHVNKKQVKNQLAVDTILEQNSIKTVIIANALRSIFKIDSDTGFIKPNANHKTKDWIHRYSNMIKKFEESGKKVIFVIDNPTLPDPRNCISGGMTSSALLNKVLTREKNSRCSIKYSDHMLGTKAYKDFVKDLSLLHPNLRIYDPMPILCDIDNNICSTVTNNKFLYSYSDHISDYANSLIAKDIIKTIYTKE
ncbi:acyltransferase [Candidatus Woesearchaeota archaeon]|jgi:peptidoglycan/LPS O-acetylase OafA/YrhL|nr:acyltransferase [Candidatus Woesearchaeota archaeon]MBT7555387.1 acyltransferase [Candidatus Woesearchaeota archaeon]